MENLKVIELHIENFLNVKAVTIRPVDDIVRIEGKNKNGKSNIIDAIWAAIGGKEEGPRQPVRLGEESATIIVDLGDIIVRRRFTGNNTYLDVKNSEGMVFQTPQKILDTLFTKISIDPSRFMTMSNPMRKGYLLELTGKKADIELLDEKRKEIYNNRSDVNRAVTQLKAKLKDAPEYEHIEEVSAGELIDAINEANIQSSKKAHLISDIADAQSTVLANQERISQLKKAVVELLCDIEQMEAEVDAIVVPDVELLKVELKASEETNRKAREMENIAIQTKELKEQEISAENLTKLIYGLDSEKQELLLKSKLPIENLEITDDDILIAGIPFDDLSSSEQIKISINIALSQNPKLRVLRMEGSFMDSESMEEIKQFAKEKNVQLWIEVVTDEPKAGFHIVNGEVSSQPDTENTVNDEISPDEDVLF